MPWSPERYHRFQEERFAPFDDLLGLVKVRAGLRVIDLGCGTGKLTARLADNLPESRVVGIDSSAEMLEQARKRARPGLDFEKTGIEELAGNWDLIFSHAALHWVENHEELVPKLLSHLNAGGQLAVQMPSNHNHKSHTLITEVAAEEPFREALKGWTRASPVLAINEYAELLHAHGAGEITVFEKVYPSLLDDADALANWTSGTTLVPYFERLPKELHEPFMKTYRERLRAHWPHGPLFYTFRRILFAATRSN
jgi:trans-aconitate 2-methyltransferase